MYEIGGWVFADLLLALTLIFMVSGTGDPPPTPTPTATANLLATSDAQVAVLQGRAAESAQTATAAAIVQRQTVAANATETALFNQQATEAAAAEQTRQAQTDSERATADAQATQLALESQATISAFATQQAGQDSAAADQVSAQATANALATQAAATATAQGAQSQATIDALSTQQAVTQTDANAVATTQADATQAAIANQTAEARIVLQDQQAAILETRAAAAESTNASSLGTAGGISNEVVQFELQFDREGLASGDADAEDQARETIRQAIGPYESAGCPIGLFIIEGNSGGGGTIGEGNALSDSVRALIAEEFPDIAGPDVFDYTSANLSDPDGLVTVQMLVYEGCSLVGGG